MKAMFAPVPDLAIKEHPIKIANGAWTAVVGSMTGTFTKPMAIGSKAVLPTCKKLDLPMGTIGRWTDAGVMDHEWLFWDHEAYMKQLGLAHKKQYLAVYSVSEVGADRRGRRHWDRISHRWSGRDRCVR
jgi:hypothetical protein